MQAARRLYLYVMSGITLAVVASGLTLLLRVVLDPLFADPEFGFENTRQQLSQAIAFLGVGVPVWAVHWWLAQRGTRPGRQGADAERGSAIRAAYFTLVLLVSLTTWFVLGLEFGRWLVTELLAPGDNYDNPLSDLTVAAVALVVWFYHGLARRRDMAAGPVAGGAAWLPRLYLYGVTVVALFAAVNNLVWLVSSVVGALDPQVGTEDPRLLVEQAGATAAWAALWLGHWRYVSRLLDAQGWRGPEERAAKVRVGAFLIVIVGTATSTLGAVAGAIQTTISPLLPQSPYGSSWSAIWIVSAVLSAAIWAIAWWWHDRRLRREPAAAEPLRSLHQARLVGYGLSGVALAIGAIAAGWLLGYGLDVLLGGARRGGEGFDDSAYQLGNWLSLAVVGLPAWAWFWRGAQARRRHEPIDEAGSTIRRTYLFLVLGVTLVSALGSASLILYRLVGILIDAQIGGNAVSELSTPAGLLVAAVSVALYHGLALRGDQRIAAAARPSVVPSDGAPSEGVEPAPATATQPGAPVSTRLRLVGPPGADLEAVLAAVRAAVPAGFEVIDIDG